ncbi:MAG: 3-deoxy-manno-octulosonate cytidylyltransferase [Maricaulaceae bacterium]
MIYAIIPARLGSTRLPQKPLLDTTGKPLIQHVYEAVNTCPLVDNIIIATDHADIINCVETFGGRAIMTSPDHTTGTDRISEAAQSLNIKPDDIIINVQGDEPEIDANDIAALIKAQQTSGAFMSTLACDISNITDDPNRLINDPNAVKVVLSKAASEDYSKALYFSRAPIPYRRGDAPRPAYLHLGLYAFTARNLKTFCSLPKSELEVCESLEQLRALENGFDICVAEVNHANAGIDTPQDYAAFVKRYKHR